MEHISTVSWHIHHVDGAVGDGGGRDVWRASGGEARTQENTVLDRYLVCRLRHRNGVGAEPVCLLILSFYRWPGNRRVFGCGPDLYFRNIDTGHERSADGIIPIQHRLWYPDRVSFKLSAARGRRRE